MGQRRDAEPGAVSQGQGQHRQPAGELALQGQAEQQRRGQEHGRATQAHRQAGQFQQQFKPLGDPVAPALFPVLAQVRRNHRRQELGHRDQQQRHEARTVVVSDLGQGLRRRAGGEVEDHVAVGDVEQVGQQAGGPDRGGEGQQLRPELEVRGRGVVLRQGVPVPQQPADAQGRGEQAGPAVGEDHAGGRAAPAQEQAHAQHGEDDAVEQLQPGDQADVPQGRAEVDEVVEDDHRGQHAGHQPYLPGPLRLTVDQPREPAGEEGHQSQRAGTQNGAGRGRPLQQGPQLPPLGEELQVAAQGTGEGHHRKRSGQHQEAEGDVPLSQLARIEPAAEEHRPAEADQPLDDQQQQQDQHAVGQGVGA